MNGELIDKGGALTWSLLLYARGEVGGGGGGGVTKVHLVTGRCE